MYDGAPVLAMPRSRTVLVLLLAAVLPACAARTPASRRGEPLTPQRRGEAAGLEVRRVREPIVVAAWAEPRVLPPGGGEAQILVRVQKQGGARFPGVEVRLRVSDGTLFSAGRTLVTDAQGMTRDRLSTRTGATITLNAGGTLYRFRVPVGEEPGQPGL